MTFAFPRYLSGPPAIKQHGKEGSKEGSRRSPQGDESDEGKEGVDVSAVQSVLLCCLLGNTDCFNSVSYTHLTLPTNREV